jgi:hypothetical protein
VLYLRRLELRTSFQQATQGAGELFRCECTSVVCSSCRVCRSLGKCAPAVTTPTTYPTSICIHNTITITIITPPLTASPMSQVHRSDADQRRWLAHLRLGRHPDVGGIGRLVPQRVATFVGFAGQPFAAAVAPTLLHTDTWGIDRC